MSIRNMLLKEHSKRNTDAIIAYVGTDEKLMNELVQLFLANEPVITQRAGWPMSYIAIKHPALIRKHLPVLFRNLEKERLHPAVVRNTFRLLQEMQIPEKLEGIAVEMGFKYVRSGDSPVAIKAFALTVLGNICVKYPELKEELAWLIREQMQLGSPAVVSRGKKILKQIGVSKQVS